MGFWAVEVPGVATLPAWLVCTGWHRPCRSLRQSKPGGAPSGLLGAGYAPKQPRRRCTMDSLLVA